MGEDYFQYNSYMREMEREAYEKGNMCFRDWEEKYRNQLQESIYYSTGDTKMNHKDWKNQELFGRLMENFGYKKPIKENEGKCGPGQTWEKPFEGEGEGKCVDLNEQALEETMGHLGQSCGDAHEDEDHDVWQERQNIRLAEGDDEDPDPEELEEGEKPDFLDLDKDGDKEESMKSAAKEAKKEDVEEQKIREAIRRAIKKALK